MNKLSNALTQMLQIIAFAVWPVAPKKLEPIKVVSPTHLLTKQVTRRKDNGILN